jgi:hypothetical protein
VVLGFPKPRLGMLIAAGHGLSQPMRAALGQPV